VSPSPQVHRPCSHCGRRLRWTLALCVLAGWLQAGASAAAWPAPAKPANRSAALGDWVAVSKYRQQVLRRDGYDYGVSLLRDADGLYRMWWCAGNLAAGITDRILQAVSLDGASWSAPEEALLPGPLALIADPAVVWAHGRYWMYYTGTARIDGTANDIYLAQSEDGEHWDRYPAETAPAPVIASRLSRQDGYGAGQPSVLFLDGQFVIYYLDQAAPGGLYRSVSTDGYTFSEPEWLMLVNDVDVKYNPVRGYYLMIRHGQFEEPFSRACLHLSADGRTFTPVDNGLYVPGPDLGDGFQLGSGILGDPGGRIGDCVAIVYAAGPAGLADAWDLHLSELYLFPARDGHVYRFFGPATKAKDHLYATVPDSPAGYEFERVAWQSPPADAPGALPLFRLYNGRLEDHFFTTDPFEKAQAMAWGYLDEGTCGSVLAAGAAGAVPIFRLYHPERGDHFYTTDVEEKGTAIAQFGFVSEGLAGFAYPPLTLPGDLTGEGLVNALDVARLRQVLSDRLWPQPWPGGELDGDGRVTVVDLLRLKLNTGD